MLTKISSRFIFLIVLLIVTVSPIIIAASVNMIPNERWYWGNYYSIDDFKIESSKGYVEVEGEKIEMGVEGTNIRMGNLSYRESSNIELITPFWQRPFLRQEVLNATSAFLEMSFELPLSTYIKAAVSKKGWIDDDFASDWVLYARTNEGGGSAMVFNDTLDVFANFKLDNRRYYLLKKYLPGINTSVFTYFVVKWRSTDHVARLELYSDSGDEFKIILDSADGVIYTGTYGGGYSEEWVESFYQLPPGKNITRIVLGVDSGGGGSGPFPVSGIQHAYFDYVQFVQTTIEETSYVRIDFNNQTLLNENLTYPVGTGIYSLDPTKYSTNTISLPIKASLLDVENSLFISIGPETIFNVTSIRIPMTTYPEKVTPAWHEVLQKTGILYVLVIGDFPLTILIIKRLLKWLKSLDVDRSSQLCKPDANNGLQRKAR